MFTYLSAFASFPIDFPDSTSRGEPEFKKTSSSGRNSKERKRELVVQHVCETMLFFLYLCSFVLTKNKTRQEIKLMKKM